MIYHAEVKFEKVEIFENKNKDTPGKTTYTHRITKRIVTKSKNLTEAVQDSDVYSRAKVDKGWKIKKFTILYTFAPDHLKEFTNRK